jgi:NAD-dependent dihydropyrimidine dehydrogenase PreA subunit
MTSRTLPGRILWGILGITALAQPVCAAICPRGRGSCPYPGKCFLYVDGDSNSLCDYTRAAVTTPQPTVTSTIHTSAIPSVTITPVHPTVTSAVHTSTIPPVIEIAPSHSLASAPSGTGFFELLQAHPLLVGIILFVCITGLIIWIYRHDFAGIKFRSFYGLLAFSALIGFGISAITVYLIMGEDASGTLFAVLYMITGTTLTAYLWKSGNISRNISRIIIILSALTGFVFLAPLMPMEFTGMVHLALGTQALTPGILGILVVLVLAFIAGRSFCAHICPVGSVQELASDIPLKKIDISRTRMLEMVRFGIFIAIIAAGLYFINLMEYTGIYDFFSLTLSVGFFIFATLLALSVLIYRPVCRIFCPFGVLFSLAGHFSRNLLVRTGACINCKKCEKACPVHCAEKGKSKRECYLCGRCTKICPVNGALVYKNREFQ